MSDDGADDRRSDRGGAPEEDDSQDDPFSEPREPVGDVSELFSEEETVDVDVEEVLATLAASGDAADAGPPGDDRDDDPPEAVLEEPAGGTAGDHADAGAVVAKASFCQRCEHFSQPPDVGCENPGTEIVELVDVDHFRVRDCPVVDRMAGSTAGRLEEGPGGKGRGRDDSGGTDGEADRRLDRVGSSAGPDVRGGDADTGDGADGSGLLDDGGDESEQSGRDGPR